MKAWRSATLRKVTILKVPQDPVPCRISCFLENLDAKQISATTFLLKESP